ncbi:MAG: prolyl oligopeptidase family serine peptidase [Bacteroidota bacterium]
MTNKKYITLCILLLCLITGAFLYSQCVECDCKKRISYDDNQLNEGIDLEAVFADPTTVELDQVNNFWSQFNPNSSAFKTIKSFNYSSNRFVEIIEQRYFDQRHYGAIIYPTNFDTSKLYPALVLLSGLNQQDPTVNLYGFVEKKSAESLPEHFIIIPSFRGQALQYDSHRFCSDGFFGDAFDGATDDALIMLHLAKEKYSNIDPASISTFGVSRGGTVSLLMGARDSSISKIIAASAPTNFHSREFYDRFGFQFKYQYLSKTRSLDAIRTKMIKSSPIYFLNRIDNPTLIIHGTNDQIVPLSEATNAIEILKDNNKFESWINNHGHFIEEWEKIFQWIKKN